jgi:hypothetical protein
MYSSGMDILKEINEDAKYDLTDMVCDLTTIFKDIVIIEPKTQSLTIQVFAKIPDTSSIDILRTYVETTHDDNVFIKIGFNAIDNSDNIERTIYKYLYNLLKYHRTPNVMRYIMSFKCRDYYFRLRDEKDKDSVNVKLWDKAKEFEDKIFQVKHTVGNLTGITSFLVLERAQGMLLHKLLQTQVLSDYDLLCIVFQVTYTLAEFDLAHIRQNDSHLGNIWITIAPIEEEFIYVPVRGKYYVLRTKYIVKIFDFDRGAFTIEGAPINERVVSMCPRNGSCSNHNPYFDTHTFCYKLYKHTAKYPIIDTIVKSFIIDPTLLTPECCERDGLLCSKLEDGKCDPNFTLPRGKMKTFREVLDGTLFDILKVQLSREQLPTERILPLDTIPNTVFSTNFYVSIYTGLTAIEMANMLLGKK